MNDGLPRGWATAPLDQLCDRLRGVSYARDEASAEPKEDSLPILRANNIVDDHLIFEDLVYVPSSRVSDRQRIRKGDVVIAMSSGSKNVVGKTAQALEDWYGAFGAFCGVLRSLPELNSRYIGLFLRTRDYRRRISELAAGTNINNLKAEHFSKIEVPLAPLNEQRRIVAKLEKLLGKVDVCQQRLAKIPVLLKRFRQSVLATACSGALTVDWVRDSAAFCSISRIVPRGKATNNMMPRMRAATDDAMTAPTNEAARLGCRFSRTARRRMNNIPKGAANAVPAVKIAASTIRIVPPMPLSTRRRMLATLDARGVASAERASSVFECIMLGCSRS